jgi:agmatinase
MNLDPLGPDSVALVGVRDDTGSSAVPGAADAPASIRAVLFDPNANAGIETGGNLAGETRLVDAGDLPLPEGDAAAIADAVTAGADRVLATGATMLALGGDHAVSFPLVRAHAKHRESFSIVQIDAHPDLYDEMDGSRLSHACPFARIMEAGLATGLVQIGIRAATPHQREQARRFGVEQPDFLGGDLPIDRLPRGPVYLSIDLDGLDPAFVPGVAHPEPGGLSTRDVIRIVHALEGPIVGADIVELNPRLDVALATARVAAKLVKEVAGRMLGEGTEGQRD